MRILPVLLYLQLAFMPFLVSAQFPQHKMTEQEKLLMPQYLREARSHSNRFSVPFSAVRASAEWEEIDALTITWTGFQSILKEIVRAAAVETRVIIVCSDSNTVKNYLTSNGVSLTNTEYLIAPFNSIWCRDYGQWNVYTNDVDTLALVDWIYNRPRAKDDSVPASVQRHTGLPMYTMTQAPFDLVHTGGNFMTDGWGTGFSSRLILDENSGKTESEIDSLMHRFMGINRYIKMSNLPYDQIHHIDMHMKLLDEETILVGEYPPGVADGPQIEANLQYVLNNFNSVFGTPYKVIRIPMPPDNFNAYPNTGGDYRTYTNATFVNKTVLVPTYEERHDTTALRIWRESLPGYNIVGINCNSIIPSLGAIHCITKEVASSDPLLISHQAYRDAIASTSAYQIDSRILHRSGISSANVWYRTDTTQLYSSVAMTLTDTLLNLWTGFIPQQNPGSTVYYYIEASSISGKTQTRPLPAPAAYWKFNIILNTEINNSISSVIFEVADIFPNPSKGITCIPVQSENIRQFEVGLYNIHGQKISDIFTGQISGEKKLFFDSRELASGVYFIRIQDLEHSILKKIIVR